MIDAHQHFWRINEHDCAWPTPALAAIYRDFEPHQLEPLAAPLGVEGSVLVQTQESDRDTDWLCQLAARTPFVKSVVGWADLAAPHAAARIAELARREKLRGLRPMLQGMADDAWIADTRRAAALEAMIAHDLRFDALVFTRHLPALRAMAQRHSDLLIVIDHAAKPPIASGALDPWREEIAALARRPNVFCKLSGLLTEAGERRSAEALKPYVDHLMNVFGPSRLMWGSDWPVLLLAGEYPHWLDLALQLTRARGADADSIFCGAARAFYRIP
ncbi:MAG TPA: amidohydrolase family protein [Caulobacterales bacterium]|nr:amidohydrolase family protein [Caulobacterales bacterium]